MRSEQVELRSEWRTVMDIQNIQKVIDCDHIKAINKLIMELMSFKNWAKISVVTAKIPIRLHEIIWAGAMGLA